MVIYDIAKTQAVFFTESWQNRLKEKLSAKMPIFDGHNIKLNNKATR